MSTIVDNPMVSPATGNDCERSSPPAGADSETGYISGRPKEDDEQTSAKPLAQNLSQLLYELAMRLPALSDAQELFVWLCQPEKQTIQFHLGTSERLPRLAAGMGHLDDSVAGWICRHQCPLIVDSQAEPRFPEFARFLRDRGINSFCALPLMIANRKRGILGLASNKPEAFHDFIQRGFAGIAGAPGKDDTMPLLPAADESGRATTRAVEAMEDAGEGLAGIIGRSENMTALCSEIKIVAPTGATVLILGETGTGKELVARAVHNLSSRCERPFIRVNCAAIPSGLLESELFGHERGAFTGAVGRRIGRFEMAHGGTLFLDEIGDIPLELQPKLLRVLQEQEFERLGSTDTIKVDVRVVAATSRDLPQMVATREFRSDLYYRLNVFPLRVPALRERPKDIGLLARHFVDLHAQRMGRCVQDIPAETMDALLRCAWPGNVRELQNFIERAVILSPGRFLRAPLHELSPSSAMIAAGAQNSDGKLRTLKDAEREHIIQALAATNWVLGGPKGAGARLGLPRTTLISKMQRLGISRIEA